jgi:sRNA-binding carbon storage regulator CsrA
MSRLVLTRRLGQSVVIHRDNEIIATIKLSRLDRNSVRLTFVADPQVNIDRQEVFDKDNPGLESSTSQD